MEKLVRRREVLNATHGSTIDRGKHHLLAEKWCCTTHGTQCELSGILTEMRKQAPICLPPQQPLLIMLPLVLCGYPSRTAYKLKIEAPNSSKNGNYLCIDMHHTQQELNHHEKNYLQTTNVRSLNVHLIMQYDNR